MYNGYFQIQIHNSFSSLFIVGSFPLIKTSTYDVTFADTAHFSFWGKFFTYFLLFAQATTG